MALTADERVYIRDMSGDDTADSDGNYEVSDVALQTIYDDAAQGNSDLNRTVYFVIRRRLGKAARLVNKTGQYQNDMHRQKFENLKELLALWSDLTGLGKGTLTSGILAMRLDYNDDDLTTDAQAG